MATTEQLQTWLTEAETARHKLMIGAAEASVQYEGKGQVTYTKADVSLLDAYIASLRSQLSAATASPQDRRRPLHLTF